MLWVGDTAETEDRDDAIHTVGFDAAREGEVLDPKGDDFVCLCEVCLKDLLL